MLVRSEHPDRVAQQLRAHYPEVELEYIESREDPLTFGEEENVCMQTLRPSGSEWLPFQVYDDTGVLEYGSDPFIDMLGSLSSDVRPEEKLVSRLVLSQKSHDWSESWRARAMSGAGSENQQVAETERMAQQIERSRRGQPPKRENTSTGTNGCNVGFDNPVDYLSCDFRNGGASDRTLVQAPVGVRTDIADSVIRGRGHGGAWRTWVPVLEAGIL